jgi:hypothetical protein
MSSHREATDPLPHEFEGMFPPPLVSVPTMSLTLPHTLDATIFRINDALITNHSDITWDPPESVIQEKLKKQPSYVLRTSHNIETVFKEKYDSINLFITRRSGRTLIVDLTNIYYHIKFMYPSYSKEQHMHYIYYLICKIAKVNNIRNIIICQQNHFLRNETYNAMADFLYQCVGISKRNIMYLTGHNESSEDDLYVILCIEAFIRSTRQDFFILSKDGYNDFFYNSRPISNLLSSEAKIDLDEYMRSNSFNDYILNLYPDRVSSRTRATPTSRGRSRGKSTSRSKSRSRSRSRGRGRARSRGGGGGTKKIKNPLFNKYARKTINFIKP